MSHNGTAQVDGRSVYTRRWSAIMGQVKKYAFRRRLEKHNYSLLGAELSDSDADDSPVTPAMEAAAAAGLDASALSPMEERDFAHVTRGRRGKDRAVPQRQVRAASARQSRTRLRSSRQNRDLQPIRPDRSDPNRKSTLGSLPLSFPSDMFSPPRPHLHPQEPPAADVAEGHAHSADDRAMPLVHPDGHRRPRARIARVATETRRDQLRRDRRVTAKAAHTRARAARGGTQRSNR